MSISKNKILFLLFFNTIILFSYSQEKLLESTFSKREIRNLKSLNISEAQVSLFNQVFASLINVVDGRDTNVDLYIVPEVIDFQYSAPAETQLKQYEIWIKYRLKINNGANQKIADWVIKGYGKTPTSLMSSSGRAFNAAATVALRDVGAQLAIQFHRHKVIQQLLKQQPLSAVKGDTAVVPVSERAPSDVIRINDSEVANAL